MNDAHAELSQGRMHHRWRALRGVSLMLGLLGLLACQSARQATEVVVVVDSDLTVGRELNSIVVNLFARENVGGSPLRSDTLPLTPALDAGAGSDGHGQYTLPLSFVLAPDQQDSAADFRLVITGINASGTEVVEQTVIASFRPGFSLRLGVFLGQRCAMQLCRGDTQAPESCSVDTGSCEVVLPSSLPESSSGTLAGYQRPDATLGQATGDGSVPADDGAATAPSDAASADAMVAPADAGYDASRVPPGPPDLTIHTLADAGALPVVAASVSGRGAAVWEQSSGTAPPHVLLYTALSKPTEGWTAPLSLSDNKAPDDDDSNAIVMMDPRGNTTVVWLRDDALFARRYEVDLERWDDEVQVRANQASGPLSGVVDASGNVTVSWYTDGSDANSARFEIGTGKWNALVGLVNDAGSKPDYAVELALAVDGSGVVLAAWTSGGAVWATHYRPSAGRWDAPVRIEPSNNSQVSTAFPSAAAAATGAGLVLWQQDNMDNSGYLTAGNAYDQAKLAWSSTTPDDPARLLGAGMYPHVVADPLGGFVGYWDDSTHALSAAGTVIGTASPIGRPGAFSLVDASRIDLAVDAHGTRVAAWAQNVPSGMDVGFSYAARAPGSDAWADITLLGASLPAASLMDDYGYPRLAVGAPGTALISWLQQVGAGVAVQARWLSFPSAAP